VSDAKPQDLSTADAEIAAPESVERYLVFDEIGVGGMASVHIGMLTGAVGFRRIVALKQLHSRFIHDPDFVSQFINEARLAARIHHANVVQTVDVVWTGTQLMLVMEYVDGDTLNRVLRSAIERRQQVPIEVACSMVTGVLHGLHAAHEVKDEEGVALDIIHRDVSPQNILIGRDGIARVLDFGVAKALAQSPNTQSGLLKGKFGYMAPEQIMRGTVDRRADVFAAGVVLWETLTCRRLFQASKNIERAMSRVVAADIPPPSSYRSDIPARLDAIVMKAVERDAEKRFQSAEELAVALESVGVASAHLVKTWFGPLASAELGQRARLIRSINKRYSPPGRSTPHPNALADEARAALASTEGDEARRRSALGENSGPFLSHAAQSGPAALGGHASQGGSASVGPASGNSGHSNTSHSNTMPSQAPPSSSSSPISQRKSGNFALESLVAFAKPSPRTLPPQRAGLRPPLLDEQSLPTTSGNVSDIPPPDMSGSPRVRLWARNVAGTILALVLFMATWVTAIGWHDQPPTSERLRARRAALLEARESGAAGAAPLNAPASNPALAPGNHPPSRELSSRTEGLRAGRPTTDGRSAGPRTKPVADRPPPATPTDLELRMTR
jgi:eukaryotic-like serine/threonine-protein kinase